MLSLLFVALSFISCETLKVSRVMTVAAIRARNPNDNFIRVTFSESQRFYKLPLDADPAYLQLLQESEKNSMPVVVSTANKKSDFIIEVEKKK